MLTDAQGTDTCKPGIVQFIWAAKPYFVLSLLTGFGHTPSSRLRATHPAPQFPIHAHLVLHGILGIPYHRKAPSCLSGSSLLGETTEALSGNSFSFPRALSWPAPASAHVLLSAELLLLLLSWPASDLSSSFLSFSAACASPEIGGSRTRAPTC